ncbi:helix-turn-helix domain-containing protein [Bacillus sp. BP-3]|uniref:helix-turn-helix domain-containing protein n=1 Tax=Bacillus sp. BP-3 TaxID=3022773 RepID=UPI00232FE0A0|nr:helix-turn-helix domain-containing protein [Bacillus sp. BP-3]MDC2866121.1 helix-turn-helix domain-containing protein [Bacillus sp. BP-3]
MNTESVGKIIKKYRILNSYTQAELAKGICTQAQISKLEKGTEIPSSIILYELAKRLGISMECFFEEEYTSAYIEDAISIIRLLIRKRNYAEVYNIVQTEKKQDTFKTIEAQQFLLWHEGICVYHLYKDKEKALELLNHALYLTLHNEVWLKGREIEILNSIAIIHCECQEYNMAISIYTKLLNSITHTPLKDKNHIQIRVIYGLARTLTLSQNYKKSLFYAEQGIKQCIKIESLYLLGELYYQKAYNLCFLNKKDKAIPIFKKALFIFESQNATEFIEHIKLNVKDFGICLE